MPPSGFERSAISFSPTVRSNTWPSGLIRYESGTTIPDTTASPKPQAASITRSFAPVNRVASEQDAFGVRFNQLLYGDSYSGWAFDTQPPAVGKRRGGMGGLVDGPYGIYECLGRIDVENSNVLAGEAGIFRILPYRG